MSPHGSVYSIFIPAFFSANGFFQGVFHFCIGFAMQGVFNFGREVGKTDTVSQAEFRTLDRKKALRIIIYSVLTGAAVALIAYFI